jgi:hypothetical protein
MTITSDDPPPSADAYVGAIADILVEHQGSRRDVECIWAAFAPQRRVVIEELCIETLEDIALIIDGWRREGEHH